MIQELLPVPTAAGGAPSPRGGTRRTRTRRLLSACSRHPVLTPAALAAALQLAWALWLATNGGDMAAQYAWAQFAAAHPGSAYDLAWYGGMSPVSYSVLTPYLMAFAGVRATGVIAGTLAAALFARVLIRSGISRPLPPALCGAVGLAFNTASGRITFAVGTLLALAAVLTALETDGPPRHRPLVAGLLGVLATLASPVDGLFLLAVAPALFLTGRRTAASLLAAGPVLVVGTTALMFPFYGVQPYILIQITMVLGTTLPLALLTPRSWRAVRIGAWTYAVGNLLTALIPSPIGSNVERLGLLFAAALLLAAAQAGSGRRARALWLVFAAALCWQGVQLVLDTAVSAPAAGWTQYAKPLADELVKLGAQRGRVEIVGSQSHVEASSLPATVELARGWNRQADLARDPLFYQNTMAADEYHAWLRDWAVGYVVLPDTDIDYASVAESRIVAHGQPWLRPVWSDKHWKVFRVADALPLAQAPADVIEAGQASLTLHFSSAGTALVRIAWSPWLSVLGPAEGCLAPSGSWTALTVNAPGTVRIGTSYARSPATPCPSVGEASGPR
ncbi:MFS transporter [Streptacidiphilus rugosus]|uniref:MFS transporter n=1 Tax=Streptacidiphilus rugosus TaxID=405783 RepID=UPI000AC3D935|nr:MFS transporter [Streptacidiphilus rugosus]